MPQRLASQALAAFAQRFSNIRLQSTSSKVVTYAGALYNVSGSTPDPRIGGITWRQLLINSGIDDNCYVTNEHPPGTSSHPGFDVGGHMTPNGNGMVAKGQSCYLMPLCNWHNNPLRNGKPFSHSKTMMLELSGYMQQEPAATFLARLPTDATFTLVGASGSQLFTTDIQEPHVDKLWSGGPDSGSGRLFPEHYLLFRQIREDGVVSYVIDDARLPDNSKS